LLSNDTEEVLPIKFQTVSKHETSSDDILLLSQSQRIQNGRDSGNPLKSQYLEVPSSMAAMAYTTLDTVVILSESSSIGEDSWFDDEDIKLSDEIFGDSGNLKCVSQNKSTTTAPENSISYRQERISGILKNNPSSSAGLRTLGSLIVGEKHNSLPRTTKVESISLSLVEEQVSPVLYTPTESSIVTIK
jgi:hypothetical protein